MSGSAVLFCDKKDKELNRAKNKAVNEYQYIEFELRN